MLKARSFAYDQVSRAATWLRPIRSRLVRSRDDLVDALHHVGYETWMSAAAAELHSRASTDNLVLKNALIESAATHARVIHGFLTDIERDDGSDIHQIDFAGLRVSRKRSPNARKAVNTLQECRRDINRRVAHLAWDRATGPVHWPLLDLSEAVVTAMADWSVGLDAALTEVLLPYLNDAGALNLKTRSRLAMSGQASGGPTGAGSPAISTVTNYTTITVTSAPLENRDDES